MLSIRISIIFHVYLLCLRDYYLEDPFILGIYCYNHFFIFHFFNIRPVPTDKKRDSRTKTWRNWTRYTIGYTSFITPVPPPPSGLRRQGGDNNRDMRQNKPYDSFYGSILWIYDFLFQIRHHKMNLDGGNAYSFHFTY